jgi:hypothetical protein
MSRSSKHEYVGVNFELPFGKHKGKLLGDLIDDYYNYIVWLHDNNILKIDPTIVNTCINKKENDYLKKADDDYDKYGFTYFHEFWKY